MEVLARLDRAARKLVQAKVADADRAAAIVLRDAAAKLAKVTADLEAQTETLLTTDDQKVAVLAWQTRIKLTAAVLATRKALADAREDFNNRLPHAAVHFDASGRPTDPATGLQTFSIL